MRIRVQPSTLTNLALSTESVSHARADRSRTRGAPDSRPDGSPRANIPAYCIYLTIHFSEEERYLIRHTGIGRYVFFRAPIPPDVTDPDKIKKLKAEDFGLVLRSRSSRLWHEDLARRLARPHRRRRSAKSPLRLKLEEASGTACARASGTTEIFRRVRAVTLWENVWKQVAREMPQRDPRPEDLGRLSRRNSSPRSSSSRSGFRSGSSTNS